MTDLESVKDDALMLRYKDGDEKAFKELYDKYADRAMRYLLYLVKNKHDAENIFQECWIKIIRAIDRHEPGNFKGYLYMIMRNSVKDHWRKEGRSIEELYSDSPGEDEVASENETPFELVFSRTCVELLRSLIEDLPYKQRECFGLQLESTMTLGEIADVLGVTREAIKSNIRYAKRTLKEQMPSECIEDLT